ncbi:MAG TPA: signal recognition particle-docking protein FtsY [Acidimicrobiia bacterium]
MDATPMVIITAVLLVLILGFVGYRARGGGDTRTTLPKPPHSALGSAVRGALRSGIDEATWVTIEEALLGADVGVDATAGIISGLRAARPLTASEAIGALRSGLIAELSGKDRGLALEGNPAIILVVGVNGTGKTTTIAKLAKRLSDAGKNVVLGAADTFRAAAGEQLRAWGARVGVPVVTGQQGGDPASVAFDTLESARAKEADIVIVDTAGRLHGKKNLMAELTKIHRVSGGDRVGDVLLVLDATLGQNGLAQAREFSVAVPITGIVLTKLDGTAKGGIVMAVERYLGVPVKFVGLGEGLDDLEPFDPVNFVDSLLEGS